MAKIKETSKNKGVSSNTRYLTRLKERYRKEVIPALIREFSYKNPMESPSVKKIVINAGVGEAVQNIKTLEVVANEIAQITGQRPLITKAK